MSNTKTSTQWLLVDAKWVDADPECDVIALTFKGLGAHYTVACSGPKGMNSNHFIAAVRASAAAMIHMAGGDISVVGGSLASEDPTFDTGNQRAN